MTFEKHVQPPPPPAARDEKWTATVYGWEVTVNIPAYGATSISARHEDHGHFFFYPTNRTPMPTLGRVADVFALVVEALKRDGVTDLRDEYTRKAEAALQKGEAA